MNNKQKERQQRGSNFESEMRESWRRLSNCWFMKITDGRGSTRPGDYIILIIGANILGEYKRTSGDKFMLSMLEPNQKTGLLDFELTGIPINNGVVFISFLNEQEGRDEAYAFRLYSAILHMRESGKRHIKLEDFRSGKLPAVKLPVSIDDTGDELLRVYDLREVHTICK